MLPDSLSSSKHLARDDRSHSVWHRAHWIVVTLLVLIVAHLGIVLSILLEVRPIIWPLHNDTIHRIGKGADFYAVYHAGVNLTLGRSPYSNAPDGVTPYWYPFRYLPIVAYVFHPLTYLPPTAAYALWVVVIEILLALTCIVLWRRMEPNNRLRLSVTGLLLLSSPYFLELYMGQFTFVASALCYLGLLLPAGALLFSVSALLKPFTLTVLPALLRSRNHWWHMIVAISILLITSLPHFVNRPRQWQIFFEANFNPRAGLDAGNYGLLRTVSLIVKETGGEVEGDTWRVATFASRYALLILTGGLVMLSKRKALVAGASALVLAHFITYQHVWEHHLSGVVLAGAMLFTLRDRSRSFDRVVLFSMLLIALPTLFGVFDTAKDPSIWDPSSDWPIWVSLLVVAPKVVGTITLFGASLYYVCAQGLCAPQRLIAIRNQSVA